MGRIVIVGAGQAGCSLVAKLRALGFDGGLTLIGDEPVPPYQRPPLSKAYLLGEMEEERLYLRPRHYYDDENIELRLGAPVTAIDPAAQTVTVGGEVLAYDQLALTTGSAARSLPPAIGGDKAGVYLVRSLADVDTMSPEFQAGRKVIVVGGGYIGLEAAAVAAKLGLHVTLLEMADRILQRVACPETSDYFRALHMAHGVEIRESARLDEVLGDVRASGVRLDDGTELAANFVIAGIGIAPGKALAEAAGLALDNGIAVDDFGRTSIPNIWAAGDCASFPYRGERIRLESVQNAIDEAECVAENIMGAEKRYDAHPWFWSDQYDVKLQIAGLNTGYDSVVVRPGDRDGAVSHWYFRGSTLLAVDAMNDPRAYMIGKRLIEAGKSPEPATIADAGADLKALLKA